MGRKWKSIVFGHTDSVNGFLRMNDNMKRHIKDKGCERRK